MRRREISFRLGGGKFAPKRKSELDAQRRFLDAGVQLLGPAFLNDLKPSSAKGRRNAPLHKAWMVRWNLDQSWVRAWVRETVEYYRRRPAERWTRWHHQELDLRALGAEAHSLQPIVTAWVHDAIQAGCLDPMPGDWVPEMETRARYRERFERWLDAYLDWIDKCENGRVKKLGWEKTPEVRGRDQILAGDRFLALFGYQCLEWSLSHIAAALDLEPQAVRGQFVSLAKHIGLKPLRDATSSRRDLSANEIKSAFDKAAVAAHKAEASAWRLLEINRRTAKDDVAGRFAQVGPDEIPQGKPWYEIDGQ